MRGQRGRLLLLGVAVCSMVSLGMLYGEMRPTWDIRVSLHPSMPSSTPILTSSPMPHGSALPDGPVLISGASSNHFDELQGLVRSIHRFLPAYRLVIFDLGLHPAHRSRLIKHCRCQVRTFKFNRYPSHVRSLHTYAFKPICINETLHEFGFVFWVDSSVRFTSSNVSAAWALARSHGFATTQEDYTVSCLVHPSMYAQLGVKDPSRYRQAREIPGGILMALAAPRTIKHIMTPWLKCALIHRCIAPEGSQLHGCNLTLSPNYCGCHRYDQSALNILIYELYPNEMTFNGSHDVSRPASFSIGFVGRVHKLLPQYDILQIRRDESVHYFPLD